MKVNFGYERLMYMKIMLSRLSYFLVFICFVISTISSADDKEAGSDASSNKPQQSQSSQRNILEVGGVRVLSRTSLSKLPETASMVEFTSTIIDSGNGPEICIGGVRSSLPPQCSGPIVVDLVMGDWSERASGISWGQRTVVVSWPPNLDKKVTLFSDREAEERTSQFDDSFPLPDECVDLDWKNTVDVEQLSNWANANPEIVGIAYFS